MDATALSIVSWNVHRGCGNDGIVDPARTLATLLGEVWQPGTGVLALQEADEEAPPHRGVLDIEKIEQSTGLRHIHADAGARWSAESHGFLGVVFFLAATIEVEDIALVDLPGHCHRGAVVADVRRAGAAWRLIGTHLSLSQGLRIAQLRTVGQHLARRDRRQTVLVGDLNEWRPWGGLALSRRVLGQRFTGPAPATFPVRRPFLPLDRILTTAPGRIVRARVLDGPGIRATSDHRPLAAEVIAEG